MPLRRPASCVVCQGGGRLVRRQLGGYSVLIHSRCWRRRTDELLTSSVIWRDRQDQWLRWALDRPCGSSLVYSSASAAANAAEAFGWFAPDLDNLEPVRCVACQAWHIRLGPDQPR